MNGTIRDNVRPRFSVVSAVYNVTDFLPEFIESIDAQTFPSDRLQFVMVDDGSTDGSLTMLREWQARRPDLVTIVTKPNGGQASARNLGLDHATGEWVNFCDPDDMLDPEYFAEVDAFLQRHPNTVMVGTNRVVFRHATRERQGHPLKWHFSTPNRLRNLNHDSSHFYGSAPCAFFSLDRLNELGLRFDERIKPNFEDGNLCDRYLLRSHEPLVGFLSSAVYLYRKRGDGTSTLDNSLRDAGRFGAVVEFGYLPLVREARERTGSVPGWLQAHLLYELLWYFKAQDAISGVETACHGAIADRFNELLAELISYFDPAEVQHFSSNRLQPVWRDVIMHGFSGEAWHADFVRIDKVDMKQRLVRLCYRFTGTRPHETFVVDGAPTEPAFEKVRDLDYFERTRLHERIVWLPLGMVHVLLDGVDVDVRVDEPERRKVHLESWRIRRAHDVEFRNQSGATRDDGSATGPAITLSGRALMRLARTWLVRRWFGEAWVLIDRVHNADDSAEHLFRYLRTKRRKINAWFVIEAGTPDHARLRKSGYKRVVPHGSLRWKLLMLNCRHLISSHADAEIVRPAEILKIIEPTWRSVFLQHGVIKDDLSRWLNHKNFDVFVTSTRGEHRSIVEDGSPYRYTEREACLTGLPRFDRIRAEGMKFPPDKRDLILVAPTWRGWLMDDRPTEHRRHGDLSKFNGSDYEREWLGYLRSPELKKLADDHGLTVAMLMHPNLQSIADQLGTPDHVRLLDYEGQNAQQLFARARVMVTDYSSTAFNAAYIDRPLVYFQFDKQRFFAGGHAGRAGYFDYERDGFGAVAYTIADAVAETCAAVEYGPDPQPDYARRIDDAFPERDGKCSKRVTNAIVASSRRVRRGPRFDDPVREDVDLPETVEPDVDGEVRQFDSPARQLETEREDATRDAFDDALNQAGLTASDDAETDEEIAAARDD